MSKYDLNFDRLVEILLPRSLRGGNVPAFFRPFIKPLKNVYTAFNSTRSACDYQMEFNGTVASLENYLNQLFDPNQKRIYITDHDSIDMFIVYNKTYAGFSTGPEVLLGQKVVYNKNTFVQGGFVVHLPSVMNAQEARIKSEIETKKLASLSYIIVYF